MYYTLADFSTADFGRPLGSRDKQKRKRVLANTLRMGGFGAGWGGGAGALVGRGNRLRMGGKLALLGGLGGAGMGLITSKPW